MNHGKELEFKHCQWLVGICKCKEVETEAIYICTRNRNCNTTILNLACSVFKIDLVLRITVSLGPTQNKMPWINKETWKATWFDLCDANFYVKLENIYPVLKQKHRNDHFSKIKLAMGYLVFHSVTLWLDLNGLLIIKTEFHKLFFHKLSNKVNSFYKDYMLSKIYGSDQ